MAQPVSMTAYRITNKRRKNRTEKKREEIMGSSYKKSKEIISNIGDENW